MLSDSLLHSGARGFWVVGVIKPEAVILINPPFPANNIPSFVNFANLDIRFAKSTLTSAFCASQAGIFVRIDFGNNIRVGLCKTIGKTRNEEIKGMPSGHNEQYPRTAELIIIAVKAGFSSAITSTGLVLQSDVLVT